MAYVFYPLANPDDTMDLVVGIQGPEARRLNIVTLLLEAGEWRVHGVGGMIAPRDLALTAYSW